jgi:hypothetical protein
MKARALALAGALSLTAAGLSGCAVSSGAKLPDEKKGLAGWPSSPVLPAVVAEPAPISGGTLLVLADGHTAVASDAELDQVWFVDLSAQVVVGNAALQPGDEPGRVVEDGAGRVHVVLRRGGAVVTIDPSNSSVARRAVCPAPRGLAYDASLDAIHVACADGSLVTLPAAGGAATRTVVLDGDLRDVVVQGGKLYVSRFRAAELLEVGPDGTIAQRITPPTLTVPVPTKMGTSTMPASPGVAYRTVALPGGKVAMLHQSALDEPLTIMPGGYDQSSGNCVGVGAVSDTITVITPGTASAVSSILTNRTVTVDLSVSPDGSQVAVAVPSGHGPSGGTAPLAPVVGPGAPPACLTLDDQAFFNSAGQTVAVAFDGYNNLVVQTRAPGTIYTANGTIPLISARINDDGLEVFYTSTGGSIACASCHPEGGDDGRVWQFTGIGSRRTQNLRGGVLARTPFHWSGDIADMNDLVNVVFVERMSGQPLSPQQTYDLGQWMDAQPALVAPTPLDAAAVARGQATFQDPNVGCTGCHDGPQISNHALVDVGTGGVFKVPSLVAVRYRAPYLHDGCAPTLLDRFTPTCGGGDQHGHTSQLDAGQLSDLVAFLESL